MEEGIALAKFRGVSRKVRDLPHIGRRSRERYFQSGAINISLLKERNDEVFPYRPTTLISFTSTFLPLLSVSTRVSRSEANSPAGYFWRLFGCGSSDLASAGVSVFVCS